MSYLSSYATRNPRVRGAGVDEKIRLNLCGFHGGAFVRVFVEDTTFRKWRRRPPHPRIRLRIARGLPRVSSGIARVERDMAMALEVAVARSV